MKTKEPLEMRLEMVEMHKVFLEGLDHAMKKRQYIEASWLCYAIFEQRTDRIIQKHISKCPKLKRQPNEKPVGISTKLKCIQKLVKTKYFIYAQLDRELFKQIENWCKRRNTLIHGLVSLEHYKHFDKEFKKMAEDGAPLAHRIYDEAKKVRDWCNADNHFGQFPDTKCRCDHQCILIKEM